MKTKCCPFIRRDDQTQTSSENLKVLDLVRTGRLDKQTALRLLHRVDVKKAGLIAVGAAAVLTTAGLVSRYGFYRGVVAKELKKQLAPVNRKLEDLQAENEKLRTEVAQLRTQQAEEAPQAQAEAQENA